MIEFYALPEPHHLGQRGSINYGNKTDNWFHTKILRETGSFELLEMRSENLRKCPRFIITWRSTEIWEGD